MLAKTKLDMNHGLVLHYLELFVDALEALYCGIQGSHLVDLHLNLLLQIGSFVCVSFTLGVVLCLEFVLGCGYKKRSRKKRLSEP